LGGSATGRRSVDPGQANAVRTYTPLVGFGRTSRWGTRRRATRGRSTGAGDGTMAGVKLQCQANSGWAAGTLPRWAGHGSAAGSGVEQDDHRSPGTPRSTRRATRRRQHQHLWEGAARVPGVRTVDLGFRADGRVGRGEPAAGASWGASIENPSVAGFPPTANDVLHVSRRGPLRGFRPGNRVNTGDDHVHGPHEGTARTYGSNITTTTPAGAKRPSCSEMSGLQSNRNKGRPVYGVRSWRTVRPGWLFVAKKTGAARAFAVATCRSAAVGSRRIRLRWGGSPRMGTGDVFSLQLGARAGGGHCPTETIWFCSETGYRESCPNRKGLEPAG